MSECENPLLTENSHVTHSILMYLFSFVVPIFKNGSLGCNVMLSILHVTPKPAHILCPITLQGIHFWIAHTPQLQFHIKYGLPQVEPKRVVCSIPGFLFSLEAFLLPLCTPQGRHAFSQKSLPGEGEKYFSLEFSGRESRNGIWLTECLSPSVGASDDLHLHDYADGTQRRWGARKHHGHWQKAVVSFLRQHWHQQEFLSSTDREVSFQMARVHLSICVGAPFRDGLGDFHRM